MATVEKIPTYPCEIAADVKEAIVKRSLKDGVSFNDVILMGLSEHFGLEYEPTGRPTTGERREGAGVTQIRRMSDDLRDRIESAKRRLPPGTKQNPKSAKRIVDSALREYLGL